MPEFCVIYNPSAGRGKTTQAWQQIQQLLGSDAVYRPTEAAWHGAELAKQAAGEGFKTIVAAGGDGTVHEVINGLLQSGRTDVAFGVLPLGSGNDYARLIKVPFDPAGMVARLRSAETWSVDVGEVILDGNTQRYFCNTVGLGLSGAVTWEAKKIRWLRGIPLYGLAALKGIWKHFRSTPVRILHGDEVKETSLLYSVIALGKAEGGGFVVAPNAQLDDGWFDQLHVGKLSRWGALTFLPKMLAGAIPCDDPRLLQGRVKDTTFISEAGVAVHADGEILATPHEGAKRCEVKMHAGRLLLRGRKV